MFLNLKTYVPYLILNTKKKNCPVRGFQLLKLYLYISIEKKAVAYVEFFRRLNILKKKIIIMKKVKERDHIEVYCCQI